MGRRFCCLGRPELLPWATGAAGMGHLFICFEWPAAAMGCWLFCLKQPELLLTWGDVVVVLLPAAAMLHAGDCGAASHGT